MLKGRRTLTRGSPRRSTIKRPNLETTERTNSDILKSLLQDWITESGGGGQAGTTLVLRRCGCQWFSAIVELVDFAEVIHPERKLAGVSVAHGLGRGDKALAVPGDREVKTVAG